VVERLWRRARETPRYARRYPLTFPLSSLLNSLLRRRLLRLHEQRGRGAGSCVFGYTTAFGGFSLGSAVSDGRFLWVDRFLCFASPFSREISERLFVCMEQNEDTSGPLKDCSNIIYIINLDRAALKSLSIRRLTSHTWILTPP
jgi:hypothetical protein